MRKSIDMILIKSKKEYFMKQVFSRVINVGLLVGCTVLLFATALSSSAGAQDASFVPRATVVLTCQNETKTDKKITSFTNNAPTGSKVVLFEQDSNGNFSTKELAVGDVVVNTPRLFWRVDGVELGPWEVPATIEGKCLTSESAYSNKPGMTNTNLLPYAIGAGSVLVLVSVFIARKKLAKN